MEVDLRNIFLIFALFVYSANFVDAVQSTDVFEEDYLADDHPVKSILDEIFLSSRVLKSIGSLIKAGFEIKSGPNRGVIVAAHPEIPGFLIKTYTDDYSEVKDELIPFLGRIKGSLLCRNEIKDMPHFKCPRKWIYTLPDRVLQRKKKGFRRSRRGIRKYVLVVEDMEIEDKKTNLACWKTCFNEEILRDLHQVITNLSLKDVVPWNLVFCKDGRIAFVDTKRYHLRANYKDLSPYLSPEMQLFWDELCRGK
jgi:hypothetical protein